jgi:hypothetical protein
VAAIVPALCKLCMRQFQARQSDRLRGLHIFCSRMCSNKYHGINKPTIRQAFDARYIPVPFSGCWLWTGDLGRNGYARFNNHLANRIAWSLFRGAIPKGMCVCHRCDVRQCVNPEHLFLGTHAENMRDMGDKGRARTPQVRGERNPRAKLTEADVIAIRSSTLLQRELARIYGLTPTYVSEIRTRAVWRHIQ